MQPVIRLDFVSDISCPWCAIAVSALDIALARLGDIVPVALHYRPYELNPAMPAAGEDLDRYLMDRLGMSRAQVAASHAMLSERGAAAGFSFGRRTRIWNTFDAHRLLAWADAEGPAGSQHRLKRALMQAYHGEDRNPGAHDVLLELAAAAGLDQARARDVLADDAYAGTVRADERRWQQLGLSGVPTLIVDERQAIGGCRNADDYERILRTLAGTTPVGAA